MRRAIFFALPATVVVAWLAIPPGLMPMASADQIDAEATRERLAALTRAKVFTGPGTYRPGDASHPAEIECRYIFTKPTGTTPKFDCITNDGERLRVKYGTREARAEVATTHLLRALGFGADDVSMVGRVRCYGCPHRPFLSRQVSERLHFDGFLEKHIDYSRYSDFEWVSVERRNQPKELEFGAQEGWAWHELSVINPALDGARAAEVDAFRLIAMFLNHWDNKASNQRLDCAPSCEHPLATIHDVGSTFGPKKVDLQEWSESPFWADPSSCTISMKHLPYEGGTFPDVSVSEEGRRLLADRLSRLPETEIRTLFSNAHFDDVDGWVAAFERRADAIAHRPPCPTTT